MSAQKKEWEDLTVDAAGYLVSTCTRIRCAGERLRAITDPSDHDKFLAAFFTPEDERANNAKILREVAASLIDVAMELEGPSRDESDSPRIGCDADLSIFRP